jgi:peroxiredoxin Q/BCP
MLKSVTDWHGSAGTGSFLFQQQKVHMSNMPKAGSKAPSFEGETQDGKRLRLADFSGRKTAIFFYPKDNTPGCTKQACNLRDNWPNLKEAGVAVIGVSGDTVESHVRFADKYHLPFPLVADPEKKILDLYGVWGERNLYGRKFLGIKRTTFLVGEDGIITHVFKRPRVGDHTEEILKAFGLVS